MSKTLTFNYYLHHPVIDQIISLIIGYLTEPDLIPKGIKSNLIEVAGGKYHKHVVFNINGRKMSVDLIVSGEEDEEEEEIEVIYTYDTELLHTVVGLNDYLFELLKTINGYSNYIKLIDYLDSII